MAFNSTNNKRKFLSELGNLDLNELYKHAVKFYKEKQGTKALVLSYKEKLNLVALIQQGNYGPFRQNGEIGFLDFIGNDRKQAWKSLGNIDKEEAMSSFVESLVNICPEFVPFIKAKHATLFEINEKTNDLIKNLNLKNKDRGNSISSGALCDSLDDHNFSQSFTKCYNTPTSTLTTPSEAITNNSNNFLPNNTDRIFSDIKTSLDASSTVTNVDYSNLDYSHQQNYTTNNNLNQFNGGAGKSKHYEDDLCGDVNDTKENDTTNQDTNMKNEIKENFLQQMKPMLLKLVMLQYPDDIYKQQRALRKLERKQLKELMRKYEAAVKFGSVEATIAMNQNNQNNNGARKDRKVNNKNKVNLKSDSNFLKNNSECEDIGTDGDDEIDEDDEKDDEKDDDDDDDIDISDDIDDNDINESKKLTVGDVKKVDISSSSSFDMKNLSKSVGIVDINDLPLLDMPSTWTKSCIKEFKEMLKDDVDSILEIGSGEIVTVRVPTHEGGTCLFWEFASDYYDIGFAIYFEWYVHNDDDDEDEDGCDCDDDGDDSNEDYIDLGDHNAMPHNDTDNNTTSSQPKSDAPTEEVIQLSRLDSHELVQCGSHTYPGPGVYLFKFDNSYSLWRSKKIYYRVFYTQ